MATHALRRDLLLCGLLLLSCFHLAAARDLTASVADPNCTKIHPACNSCKYITVAGKSTATCLGCTTPKYALFSNSTFNTCACAPGYYSQANQPQCEACPLNNWCSGSTAQPQPCNRPNGPASCLFTLATAAASTSACITRPGCGVDSAGLQYLCWRNMYSVGGSRQPCVPCPGGLVTGTPGITEAYQPLGATSVDACVAGPGYFFKDMHAVPCPFGSFQPNYNRDPTCKACRAHFNTTATAAIKDTDCNTATPGYRAVWHMSPCAIRPCHFQQVIFDAEPCPVGSYSPTGAECLACPSGLTTRTTATVSVSGCVRSSGQ